ncbi:MAG: substrate-binding domain-containing protein, partial [Ilumatobacter sp.]|nr:substrate-binding domain-containing protein [Ilumatobacter sp.]
DGSGTTKNFTTFLDRAAGPDASGIWTLGAGDTGEWPADTQAGEGNGGVAQIITSTVGAIGYVDLSDATDAGLNMALVQNSSGNYVGPTVEGASAAAGGAEINDNLTYSAIWADGADAYPITAQTWIIVYKVQPDAEKGMLIKAFLEYVLTDGQDLAGSVSFAPLPAELQQMAIDQLDQLEIG